MPRDQRVYIDDMLRAAASIREYVQGCTREQFDRDRKTQDAVMRNLEILGEASKRVSSEHRDRYPEIPWRSMGSMRDLLIHAYHDVDLDIVWEVVTNKLPELERQLRQI